MTTTRSFAVLGLLLAAGLWLFGMQVGSAVKKARDFDRYFTVRGLSERHVKATLVVWPIKYAVVADDLPGLKKRMEWAKGVVLEYLSRHDISEAEMGFGLPQITDRLDSHRGEEPLRVERYQALVTMVVRSRNIDAIKRALQGADSLISSGIPLIGSEYEGESVKFSFDAVNELKPQMIEEATASARLAAQQFAQDSRAKVGAIRKATQGVVDIQDRDPASPELKVVRVVTTVEFFIE
ncbi:MAG: hypothetical protein BWK76_19335 [Desulfobulbaceae bacterium A2]|nr:MAG: hypothetical protein BWK76_19335 [Desulfobulbaceae bacterium A2]